MGAHQGDALDLVAVQAESLAPTTDRNAEDPSAHLFWYGRQGLESPKDLEVGWRAVRAIAAGEGRLTAAMRLALAGKMCVTGVPRSIIEAVMGWDRDGSPADLVASVTFGEDARARMSAWVLYEGISASFADGVISLDEVDRLTSLAATMGISRGVVDELIEVCCEEALLRERRIVALHAGCDAAARCAEPPSQHAPPSTDAHAVRSNAPTIPAIEHLPVQGIPRELRVTRAWRR